MKQLFFIALFGVLINVRPMDTQGPDFKWKLIEDGIIITTRSVTERIKCDADKIIVNRPTHEGWELEYLGELEEVDENGHKYMLMVLKWYREATWYSEAGAKWWHQFKMIKEEEGNKMIEERRKSLHRLNQTCRTAGGQ